MGRVGLAKRKLVRAAPPVVNWKGGAGAWAATLSQLGGWECHTGVGWGDGGDVVAVVLVVLNERAGSMA